MRNSEQYRKDLEDTLNQIKSIVGYDKEDADGLIEFIKNRFPRLKVWTGSMPESNGKSNFTATLMREGGHIFDSECFTFYVSEYPGRMQYEADSMKFLIGEIKKEPFILDYDTDKHSGYAHPPLPDRDWIDAKVRPPEPGYIVKRWKNGSTWSGLFTGDPKMASCDYWFKLPNF